MAAIDMTTGASLGGAVLAGGASRRMGRDKAMLELDGVTLAERAMRALAEAEAEPVVVVGGDDALGALGLRQVPDRWPGEGPLGGIITALREVPTDVVMVLACDLTNPSPIAIRAVVDALGDADLVVPVVGGRSQWMHAAWHRRGLSALEAAFAAGSRAPRDAVEGLRVGQLDDADPRWFHDADTPEDLFGHRE